MTYQRVVLIGDAHLNRWNLVMVNDKYGFSTQQVALTGRLDKHDATGETKGELPSTVHEGSHGKVGQSKEYTALAHAPTVQVFVPNCHFSHGVTVIDLGQLATGILSEMIGLIQQLFNVHFRLCLLQS